MRSYSVSQFKAHSLGLIAGVNETGKSILITKRGKPLAVLTPYQTEKLERSSGQLAGSLLVEGDLVAPLQASGAASAKGKRK